MSADGRRWSPERPDARLPPAPVPPKDTGRSFLFTFVIVVVLAAFLSPLLRSLAVSLRRRSRSARPTRRMYPADPADVRLQRRDLRPLHGPDRRRRPVSWRSIKPGRTQSQFVDPANPRPGPITWEGSWRTLSRSWSFSPAVAELRRRLEPHRLPAAAVQHDRCSPLIGMIGTVVSCTLVAYGFARFRFPGRSLLFTLLVATIFLPVRGDAHPDVHDLREARLGRDLAAAARPDVLRQRLRRVPAAPVPA